MASAGDPVDSQHMAVAASDDTYCNHMSATLADLVSQFTGDISSLNKTIYIAEKLRDDAPADICIPSSFWENLGVLFEMRYQRTKDLDDLQEAITWTELAAATTAQDDVARERCLSKVDVYLAARNEHSEQSEVPHKAKERMNDATPETPHDMLIVNSKQSLDSLDDMIGPRKPVKLAVETSSLDSISAMLADIVSQPSGDLIYLNNAILVAQEVLVDAPEDICLPADIFQNLSVLFEGRYQQTKELDDLQTAITWAEQGAAAIPRNMGKLLCLCNLVSCLFSRYEHTGDVEDLHEAVKQLSEINITLRNIPRTPANNIRMRGVIDTMERLNLAAETFQLDSPDSISAMGTMLGRRFERTGDSDALQQAILWAEEAVAPTPLDHPQLASALNSLGLMFGSRFERTGNFDDLQQAILRTEEAVAATPLDHPDRATWLNNLGNWLNSRFRLTGNFNDLQQAILLTEEAVAATPLDDPDRGIWLSNLGNCISSRFKRTGNIEDLQQAILRAQEAVAATPLDHHDRARQLSNLGSWLGSRFERTGDFNDLQQAILRTEEAVAAARLDQPDRANQLNNLGTMFCLRFEQTGDLNDLQQAILRAEEAVAATPLDHPDRAGWLSNLGNRLNSRFKRTGDFDDLQQAILRAQEAVVATPLNHPNRADWLNCLGIKLISRFERTGDFDDLQQAILRAQEAVAATPLDHPHRASALNNLGVMLGWRFKVTGRFDDLQQAILRAEEAVATTSLDHTYRAHTLNTLGNRLRSRFERTGDFDDLQKAILRAEEAVAATPLDHPDRANRLISQGNSLSSKFKHTENPHDRECAIQCFRECTTLHSAAPTSRIEAAIVASSMLMEDQNWVDSSEITKAAVNLLPRVSSRSLDQRDQQHIIKKYAGLASRAAAMALQAGKPAADAVQLLEQGRGVIANLQFETRTDLTELRQLHPQVAKEFEQLRDSLDSSGSMSMLSTQLTAPGSSRHSSSLALDKTIATIRQLPNFERFLLPPTASELMRAAAPMHPVVLINVSTIRCDAFLIQHQSIISLNLPCLHEATIKMVAKVMKSRSPTRNQMFELLQWLWEALAGPVLDELGFCEAVTTEEWPRVSWIPTGPLCHLPIHAAGYHRESGSRTVLDRVVSSYSPSIKALLYARRNITQRTQSQVCNKAVLVSMDTTPGCSALSFARKEILELQRLFPASIPRVILDAPFKNDVLTALDNSSVFHFAGHGLSHPSDPSMSTLLMTDWQKNPLTVKDLVALKFHQKPPLLAYLSACSTGDNQELNLLDEGIHLMGACQLAGFRHVIGSLWEVSDKHCVDVAKDVYSTMIKADMSDKSVSQGLHNAVLNLRGGRCRTSTTREARNARLIGAEREEEGIADPFIWAAYIHMGI